MFRQFFCHLQFWFIQSTKLNWKCITQSFSSPSSWNGCQSVPALIRNECTPRSPFQTLRLPFISNYLTLALFLLSRKKGFANFLSVIVITSILGWFFSSFEIGNMFGMKDPIPRGLRRCVVYKFLWAGCNVCYVGETSQHLSTRVREHLLGIGPLTFSDI